MKKPILFSFYFIILTIIYVPFGTITHELGHFVVSIYLGYDSKITYNHTTFIEGENILKEVESSVRNQLQPCISDAIIDKIIISENEELKLLSKTEKQEYLLFLNNYKLILIGGILSTILIGSISLFILLFNKKDRYLKLNIKNIFLVLTSLFWLREVYIFLGSIFLASHISNTNSDEVKLAHLFHIPELLFSSSLGIIGLVVFFKILSCINNSMRIYFIISLLTGSFIGYIFWFKYIGPFIDCIYKI